MNDQRARIIEFQKYLGISMRTFESSIGVSNGAIKAAKNLSGNLLEKVIAAYPMLNRVWVLTGIGDMLLPQGENVNIAPNYGTAQQVGVGNQMVTADAEEITRLRERVCVLEKEISEKDKMIARLEGKIETYKEMLK